MQLRKFGSNGNEQIKCQNELCSIFKSLNSGFKQDCFVWLLEWLCKVEVWDNAEIWYMVHSFIAPVNLEDVYEDLAEDVKIRFDISNYKVKGPLFTSKNKKVMRLTKISNYLKDVLIRKERVQKYALKLEIKFPDCKKYLENNKKRYQNPTGSSRVRHTISSLKR